MRIISIVVILFITAILFQSVVLADTSTIVRDFGNTNLINSQNEIFCTIDVAARIQTEPSGAWVVNRTYQANWLIQITYLNQSLYSENGFSIEFYNPANPVNDAVENLADNQTIVTQSSNGILPLTLTPQTVGNASFNSSFDYKVFYYENLVTTGTWSQSLNNNPPINIEVENSQSIPEFPTIAISLVLLSLFLFTVSAMKKLRIYEKLPFCK